MIPCTFFEELGLENILAGKFKMDQNALHEKYIVKYKQNPAGQKNHQIIM